MNPFIIFCILLSVWSFNVKFITTITTNSGIQAVSQLETLHSEAKACDHGYSPALFWSVTVWAVVVSVLNVYCAFKLRSIAEDGGDEDEAKVTRKNVKKRMRSKKKPKGIKPKTPEKVEEEEVVEELIEESEKVEVTLAELEEELDNANERHNYYTKLMAEVSLKVREYGEKIEVCGQKIADYKEKENNSSCGSSTGNVSTVSASEAATPGSLVDGLNLRNDAPGLNKQKPRPTPSSEASSKVDSASSTGSRELASRSRHSSIFSRISKPTGASSKLPKDASPPNVAPPASRPPVAKTRGATTNKKKKADTKIGSQNNASSFKDEEKQ